MTLEELIENAQLGKLEKVLDLLKHGVNVNAKNEYGLTALIWASNCGHLDVVRALLNHPGVDVNITNSGGWSALIRASICGKLEVVRALLTHDGVDVNLKDINGNTALIGASYYGFMGVVCALLEHKRVNVSSTNIYGETALDRARKKNNDDIAGLLEEHIRMEKERCKLLYVMNTSFANPVKLPLEYIERCIKKDHKLGSGAFSDTFLAEDSRLPRKFVVKTVRHTHSNEDAIEEIRNNVFQTELSTLKKFRHPNIVVLYGYSLNPKSSRQCLVYEYAANGSLADFLTDDGNRARLSASNRVSIMFQLVRAVHLLHTGGCKASGKGWNVFHRNIKSSNIWLTDDFTARLSDYGLAECVPDDNTNPSSGSVTCGPALGTPGYMCPEYLEKKRKGLPCPYIAAYDVYSIGVVLVELILGCLNARQSTRYGTYFLDVFARYIQDERTYQRIVDGWKKLILDADPSIDWNPDALELVCKAAIQCIAPFPEERLSTNALLDMLKDAIRLNTGAGNLHREAETTADSDPCCVHN